MQKGTVVNIKITIMCQSDSPHWLSDCKVVILSEEEYKEITKGMIL